MKKKSIFSYDSFFDVLNGEILYQSESRRGIKKELAEHINIHPTSLSQVLAQSRSFTEEQVFLLNEFLNFNETESQYVFLLFQISNAQNLKYKNYLNKRKENFKKKLLNLSNRIEKDKTMEEEQKAIFYSAWYYTCIWVYISIKGGKTREDICERFDLDVKKVNEVLDFLIETDLAYLENRRYFNKINRTHLEKNSPYLKQHHANWRIKSIEKKDRAEESDLSFTAPLSLSKKDFDLLREEIVELIKKVSDTVKETRPEDIYCLNLDFFKI